MSIHLGRSVSVRTVDFAKRAASYFRENIEAHSYTDGEIKAGELLALRWAFDKAEPATIHSVMVVEIGFTAILVEDV